MEIRRVVTGLDASGRATVVSDGPAARAERRIAFPGVAEQLEPDSPGMHTTNSVDYVIVLDGDLWLELDDGQLTRLGPGDTIVQNGTRHAWRNLSARPATVAVVQVGAEREG
ncbi:MAG: cupin domain-containing protein [Trebonia sp.]